MVFLKWEPEGQLGKAVEEVIVGCCGGEVGEQGGEGEEVRGLEVGEGELWAGVDEGVELIAEVWVMGEDLGEAML